MHRMGPGIPRELQPLDDKAQGGVDAVTAIIAFLIEGSANPEETKEKLNRLLSKYGSSSTLVHLGKRVANLLK